MYWFWVYLYFYIQSFMIEWKKDDFDLATIVHYGVASFSSSSKCKVDEPMSKKNRWFVVDHHKKKKPHCHSIVSFLRQP